MKFQKQSFQELRDCLILWLTQSFSSLGSAMTSFALIVWSYQQEGSALSTAMLSVCTYAPYVIMSIFAGALSDRWNKKKIMLWCDALAAFSTVCVLILLLMNRLELWHLYVVNAISGLMNTVQQPASDVTKTLLTPKQHYQRMSGLYSFSSSLTSVLSPVFATVLLTFGGIKTVIAFDLLTFAAAFLSLLFLIRIPNTATEERKKEPLLRAAAEGLSYLKNNRGILDLIFFLAAINLTASIFNAAFPAMVLSKADDTALGTVNAVRGIAMIVGSMIASMLPEPKSRVRMVCNTLLISMSTENFLLAFGKTVPVWCLGEILGWLVIPIMNANLDVIMRSRIPVEVQGRVYASRNTLQFFTIPLGYLLGGWLVDDVFEPLMAMQHPDSLLSSIFGIGKGSGAALLFLMIGFVGVLTCIVFRLDKHIWNLEKQ